jgi:LysM repeat protein
VLLFVGEIAVAFRKQPFPPREAQVPYLNAPGEIVRMPAHVPVRSLLVFSPNSVESSKKIQASKFTRGETTMGLFDKMFGRGASEAEQQQGAQQRFNELKQKYQSVLNLADQEHIQFQNLHIQDNKLYIKGNAPSEEAKNKFWDQIKLVNPNTDDVTAEINVDSSKTMGATAGAGGSQGGGETYTIKSGDTLSRISKQFYGDANEYMRIFYANRDKLKDPDKIQVGQQLVIPADDNT